MTENEQKAEISLDGDFAADERLLHYTSSQGLFGILETGCLWATNFKFLNDSNEFFAAKKSLTDFVELEIRKKMASLKVNGEVSFKSDISIGDLSKHEAGVIVDAMYSTTLGLADPFVFSSFVSNCNSKGFRNGELLHWATYGRDGGYALEINPHKLSAIIHDGPTYNLISQKAVYVDDGAPPELKDDYAVIGKVAQEMIVGILKDELSSAEIDKTAGPFMKAASIIKDGYFRSEKEARLVAMRFKTQIPKAPLWNVFVRHKENRAVPYIKLFEGQLLGENCPIEAIVIGPHSEKNRRFEMLSLFLQSHGLSDIKIFQSEVPYLGG